MRAYMLQESLTRRDVHADEAAYQTAEAAVASALAAEDADRHDQGKLAKLTAEFDTAKAKLIASLSQQVMLIAQRVLLDVAAPSRETQRPETNPPPAEPTAALCFPVEPIAEQPPLPARASEHTPTICKRKMASC